MQNVREYAYGQNIAVTGATGYIGSALIKKLSGQSSKLLAVGRSKPSFGADINFLQADIRNSDTWSDITKWADVIFHLAGNTSALVADNDPAESLRSTVLPVAHLVRAASEYGRRPRVVFASTATVYGLTTDKSVDEAHPTNPITAYDLHKLFAEQQLAMATELGIIDAVSLRLANVYGPSASASFARDRGVLNKVVETALRGEDVAVYGGGHYLRDYVYIDDVIAVFECAGLMSNTPAGAFNVASGVSVSVRRAFERAASIVELHLGRSVRIANVPWPCDVRPIETRGFVANIEKTAAIYGWVPQVSLDSGIRKLIEHFDARKG